MCITRLDNTASKGSQNGKTGRNMQIAGYWLMMILAFTITGCVRARSAQPNPGPAGEPEVSTKDRITEAENFYRQRKDLSNARRAIIDLRQVRTGDPGNFEAAWKLAEF